MGKSGIALELLDQVRSEGWPAGLVAAGAGLGADREFREALNARGWTYLLQTAADVELEPGETLWPADGVRRWVGNSLAAPSQAEAARRAAAEARAMLTTDLGMDHFEGRSWRGFHHHTCLVMLAYGFRFFYAATLTGYICGPVHSDSSRGHGGSPDAVFATCRNPKELFAAAAAAAKLRNYWAEYSPNPRACAMYPPMNRSIMCRHRLRPPCSRRAIRYPPERTRCAR